MNTKSEAIVVDVDEVVHLERQIDEIDEEIECYKRVELLRDKQDVVKSKLLSHDYSASVCGLICVEG